MALCTLVVARWVPYAIRSGSLSPDIGRRPGGGMDLSGKAAGGSRSHPPCRGACRERRRGC
eukprot:11205929-Alexandrium_andersonii.AAC.1